MAYSQPSVSTDCMRLSGKLAVGHRDGRKAAELSRKSGARSADLEVMPETHFSGVCYEFSWLIER